MQTKEIHKGNIPPTDISMVWIDTTDPDNIQVKVFLNGKWTSVISKIISTRTVFKGIATPETDPGELDGEVFYFATEAGVYENFGGIELDGENLVILKWDGEWSEQILSVPTFLSIQELAEAIAADINKKQDAPVEAGSDGQILSMQPSGPAWINAPEGTVVVDSEMSDESENPVQNNTIKAYVDQLGQEVIGAPNFCALSQTKFPIKGLQANFVCSAATLISQYNRADFQRIQISFTIEGESITLSFDDDSQTPYTGVHHLLLQSAFSPQYEAYITFDFSYAELQTINAQLNVDAINFVKEFDYSPTYNSKNLVQSGGVYDELATNDNKLSNANIVTLSNTDTTGWQPSIPFIAKKGCTISFKNLTSASVVYIAFRDENGNDVAVYENVEGYDKISFIAQADIASVIAYYSYPNQAITFAVIDVPSDNGTIFEDAPSDMTGIVDIAIFTGRKPMRHYEKFKVTNVYYNSSDFYLFLSLHGYIDGAWEPIDAIEIPLTNAPTDDNVVKVLKSKYGIEKQTGFMLWLNTSLMPAQCTHSNVNYIIKNSAIRYYDVDLQNQINAIKDIRNAYEDYALQDHISHSIVVDANGTGDYTTIGAAIASITDSSFDNQYLIWVKSGTYNENGLTIPPFTHICGENRDGCIVTSQGLTGTEPVFDQVHTSKLSNLTVISYTGYCVHFDQSSLPGCVAVNTNCIFRKEYGEDVRNQGWLVKTNPSIFGIGAHITGTKFINRNCVFENGYIAAHTIGNPSVTELSVQYLLFENCVLMNAFFQMITLDATQGYNTNGICTLEIKGIRTNVGYPTLDIHSPEDLSVWSVIGGENTNFSVIFTDYSGQSVNQDWDKINTNEKVYIQLNVGVSATKGKLIDIFGDICNSSTPINNILGFCLNSVSNGAIAPVWVGNAYPYSANDGEYGIDDTGSLDANANIKIGFVKNNIFYRY